MADMLADGEAWLIGKLGSHAAKTVTLKRGSASVSITATKPREQRQITVSGETIFLGYTVQDWIVAAADYTVDGVVVLPERYDKLLESVGTETYWYELLPDQGLPAWEYMGGGRKMIRLHSKRFRVTE